MIEVIGSSNAGTAIVGTNGAEAGVTTYGYLRVTNEPSSWFTEPFDTLDTTNRWTTKLATGTAAVTNGVLAISSSTTASAYGGLSTQPTFCANGLNFVALGCTLIIPTWTQANTKRFWGWGSVPTTPTTAIPVTNGAGFEIDDAGNFLAVVYETNVRTQAININTSKVPDGQPFYTAIARRADRIDFYVNDTLIPAATILIPTLDISTLPAYLIAVNGAVAPAAAATMNVTAFGIADTGQNAQSIKDPTNPFWAAAVTKPSTAVTAAQSALAVAIHPTSVLNGQSAHDAVIAGAPVRLAGRALSAAYATVATGDTADLMTTLQGVLTVRPYTIPELEWSYASAAGGVINTTDVVLSAAAGAGLRRYIATMTLSNNSATATEVVLKDGATIIWRGHLPANAPNVHIHFQNPLKTSANAALNFACITTAAAVYVNAQGYTAP
ncbi:hypothetical protein UFOVP748_28 [uncultured Caudovirales phage]|uniref:Uncharacterized protein n=1 Tax=uncultured Caudovirales phage TaxID=2100421 RepID=A0A6J5NJJ7_9CAUD|nr:hypothetical protein UFOVP680_17 [uncultured Caudovirales phage]CAB5225501.1 hypothetical protein UFOVP748_28 [uncultured Caudovirales phage]